MTELWRRSGLDAWSEPQAWIVSRFRADVMSPASMAETRDFINGEPQGDGSGSGFQITDIGTFQSEGHVPYTTPISQSKESKTAQKLYGSIPSKATTFFEQLGKARHKLVQVDIPKQLGDAHLCAKVRGE